MASMSIKRALSGVREYYAAHRKAIILGGFFFLIATFSFALGYLASRETNTIPIIIRKCAPEHD